MLKVASGAQRDIIRSMSLVEEALCQFTSISWIASLSAAVCSAWVELELLLEPHAVALSTRRATRSSLFAPTNPSRSWLRLCSLSGQFLSRGGAAASSTPLRAFRGLPAVHGRRRTRPAEGRHAPALGREGRRQDERVGREDPRAASRQADQLDQRRRQEDAW